MESLKISMSALDVEWQRLQVIAQNLANINSTRNELGDVFRPKRLHSGPALSFSQLLSNQKDSPAASGVRVMGIEDIPNGIRTSYEPEHPHADGRGMVQYPKVNHAAEMTLMVKTSRIYEANLTAISIARQMYNSALNMGRGS